MSVTAFVDRTEMKELKVSLLGYLIMRLYWRDSVHLGGDCYERHSRRFAWLIRPLIYK